LNYVLEIKYFFVFALLSTFFQNLVVTSNEKVSPVIENRPVSPVAPPKRMALPFAMNTMVCPNRA